MYLFKVFVIFIVIYLTQVNAAALSRQKRCIVIQKQSGTYNDSDDTDDDSYRSHGRVYGEKNHLKDTEPMPSEFLRYNIIPTNKIGELLRIRNKFKTFKL